jgi:hypothetical protein
MKANFKEQAGGNQMRFRFLTGDINWKDYGGKFISKRLNNGEFDYWLIIEVINMFDACGEDTSEKYAVSLLSVSPAEAGADNLKSAFDCCGLDPEADYAANPLVQVEALAAYGVYAQLISIGGNNLSSLMRRIRKEAASMVYGGTFYGFYMDRPENQIGSTGWDLQRGDLMAGLNRR